MTKVRIRFDHGDGTKSYHSLINFKFKRERYTPYTTLEAHLLANITVTDITAVYLYIDGNPVHCGMADMISHKNSKGRNIITVFSRGFSMLLGQNEPIPGIISDTNLSQLVSYNTKIPFVECQQGTDNVNYIYVKEKSTIWDAICAYAYKAYKTYPYITQTNTINVSPVEGSSVHDYSSDVIIHYGDSISTTGMISQIYMADSNGEYSYTLENVKIAGRNIVRKKYYPLDRQWLSSPYDGLQSKLNYSNKGYKTAELQYKGFKYENLMDKAVYQNNNFLIDSESISAIEVTGNRMGIFTKIVVYRDSYAKK